MNGHDLPRDGNPLPPSRLHACQDDLLDTARDVSGKAIDRVRLLSERYPGEVPPLLLADLDAAKTDRRVGVRLRGDRARLRVRVNASVVTARLLDRSPGGLRLEFRRPVADGTVV